MNVMNDELKKLLDQIQRHERTHNRERIESKIAMITKLCERFQKEYDSEAQISLKEENNAIEVTITADFIMSCDATNSFNYLTGLANYTEVRVVDNKLSIFLWFRCWKWVKK